MFPSHIFKAYDIRGLYPQELNEDLAYKIARAYGVMREKELGRQDNIQIVVGYDMRVSSPALAEAVKKGLQDQGINVIDVGLVSTPTFYFAIAAKDYDGGLLVSASHNPKEYNGLKIVRGRATPVGAGTGMEELKAMVEKGEFPEVTKKGSTQKRENVLEEQVKFEETYAGLSKIGRFKIVADTANSMGAAYLEKLFQALPQIELIKMNWDLDGTFPSHQPDPLQEHTLLDLKKKIVEEKADLGIATDGDGDRLFFVDETGVTLEPAILRGIMARIFLRENPGAIVCYDIRPGKITEDMIREAGGVPSVTKVGHSLIKKQMLEVGAIFGGESSGHFFVKFPHGVYEAPMVIVLKLLQELTETKMSLSEYIKPLKRYFHSGEINFKLLDRERVSKVLENLRAKYHDAEINDLDGLTFTYPDFWFNVRASNTEPLLRLGLEARTPEIVKEKVKEVTEVINS